MEDIENKIKRKLIGKIENNVDEAFSRLREKSNSELFDSQGRLQKRQGSKLNDYSLDRR